LGNIFNSYIFKKNIFKKNGKNYQEQIN